ncbi:ATP-binding protein [Caldimonas manganoxidans]|uniref:ATP-binding protein n=1 Tax=Caldimonas manganoxidans TaxID=196015 RepID=UPI001FE0FBD3|nr:ATP-binding protein [Caldimonas manganoxidans]
MVDRFFIPAARLSMPQSPVRPDTAAAQADTLPRRWPQVREPAQLEARMRERLFWFTVALSQAGALGLCAYFWWSQRPGLVAVAALYVAATLGVSAYAVRTGRIRRSIAVLMVVLAVALTALTWLMGGWTAPSLWWLVLLPMMWMLTGARREGLMLGGVILGVLVLTPWAVEGLGLPDLSPTPPAQRALDAGAWAAAALVLFGCFVLYALGLRRGLRRELTLALRELRRSRDEALAASQVKARFLANMSHEVRTPINGILGAIELLRGTPLDARQQQIVALQRQSLDTLMALVNDVLDYTKIEAGRMELEPVDTDLRELVFDALELHAALAHEKGLELTLGWASEVPPVVRVDPTRLRQVLGHLVSNAVRYTSRGGVHIQVGVEPEGLTQGQARLRIEVQDTGVGIAPELLPRLFEAFPRSEEAAARGPAGSGLGLAICRELVQLMGGRISVRSELHKGSVFTLELTLDHVEQPHAGLPPGVPLRVLVVANYLRLVQHVEAGLREFGVSYDIKPVPPTQTELLALRDQGVNAILLDEKLLGARGHDRLEQMAREVGLPVLLMRGVSSDTTMGMLDGVFVLSKPVRPHALYDGLRWALHARRQSERATPAGAHAAPAAELSALAGRVLLVDDNPVNQVMTQALLERLGLAVVVAGDGREALHRFAEQTFDFVLMDVQMPGMDGLTATQKLREIEGRLGRARTPVIAVTGNPEPEIRQRGQAVGMDDFLGKPFTLEQLQRMLLRWQPGPREVPAALRADGPS